MTFRVQVKLTLRRPLSIIEESRPVVLRPSVDLATRSRGSTISNLIGAPYSTLRVLRNSRLALLESLDLVRTETDIIFQCITTFGAIQRLRLL